MAALCVNGRKNLRAVFQRIVETFESRIDYSRGIFLKPNIVFPVKDRSGEITRSEFVKTLVGALRERRPGVDIAIGEGVAAGCDPQENFRVSGYSELASELNIALIDLHNTERKTVSWKFGTLELPSIALERTYINLPILKPSSACVISGALKNQKGLVSPAMKKQFHRLGLNERIAALNSAVHPALTIMDCSIFLGNNAIIAGDNCGEIDAAVCTVLDIPEPDHVRFSRNQGVFKGGYQVQGDTFDKKNVLRRPGVREFKRLGRLRLWSNPAACSMCRYLFMDIRRNLFKRRSLAVSVKLLKFSIQGAEVVMGSNPEWRRDYKNVVCVGECTRALAQAHGYKHVPGCPPSQNDFAVTR